ncbi:AraC family transcriptional regulator [Gluconobacter sphaericus]|uniref:AraC family transcriptional regulator n=1 Tax=Gluconobacter sphaericus TaxID=574987 RepID=UPI002012B181|nr:helix-turn-helix transcriptional regulator [Gluconobacter sphaericus]
MYANSFMTPAAADRSNAGTPWLLGGHMKQNTRRVADRHAHERGQIFGIESGVMAIRTEHAYWLIGPGQCLWLPPHILHEARSHGAVSGWSLYAHKARCTTLPDEPFIAGGTRLLTALADRLSRDAYEARWDAHIARLAECFWHEFLAAPRASVSLPFPKSEQLCRVANSLSDNPADPRAQKDWARLAAMSLRSFVRHFTLETGLPFSVWRQRLRILNAQEKLARGESVASVALDVGYESLGAFATTFHKNTGYRPSDYAKLCRTA